MNGKQALLTIGLLLAAGHAAAQTTATGPYYATPSWDQTMPATTRFVILSNFDGNAVLDRETGLVWQRALSATRQPYTSASLSCARLGLGTRLGWRLPSIAELGSLFDPSAPAPFLPVGHPFAGFTTSVTNVWSSTRASATVVAGDGTTYGSHAAIGRSGPLNQLLEPLVTATDNVQANYLCVRGGPGPDFIF